MYGDVEVDEDLDQIGNRLRSARVHAGLTVDDVEFRTRIPRSVIRALETEDFSVFTSPTYAKSFLRQYSEYLNVDAEPWLDALVPASYVSGEAWQPMFSGGEPTTGHGHKHTIRDPRKTEHEKPDQGNQWSAVWLIVLTAGIVFGSVKGYQFLESKFGHEEPAKHESASKDGTKAAEPRTSSGGKPSVMSTVSSSQGAPPSTPRAAAVTEESGNSEQKSEKPETPPRAVIVREQ